MGNRDDLLPPDLGAAVAARARGRPGSGRKSRHARREDRSGARLHRRDRRLLPRQRQGRSPHPRRRVPGGPGRPFAPLSRRPRGRDLPRDDARLDRACRRPDARPAEEGRRDPERPARGRAAAPGPRALPDPRVRLPDARRPGARRRARVREDRALLAARAAHAVAHLHAARALAGVDRLEHRLGRRGEAPGREEPSWSGFVRRAPRARLPRVRVPSDRRSGEGEGGARRGGLRAEVRRRQLRGRLRARRHSGALGARAARLGRRRRAHAAAGRALVAAVPLRAGHHPLRARDRRARTGKLDDARAAVGKLEEIHAGLVKSPVPGPYDWTTQIESMRPAAAAWIAFAEGKKDEAVELARSAADLDDKAGKHPVTPGAVLPARELLGRHAAGARPPGGGAGRVRGVAALRAEPVQRPLRRRARRGAPGDKAKAKELYARLAASCGPASTRKEVRERARGSPSPSGTRHREAPPAGQILRFAG